MTRSAAVSLDREPVVLSWSGGKDSALALAALREDAGVEVRSFDASRLSMEQVFLKVYGHAHDAGVAA